MRDVLLHSGQRPLVANAIAYAEEHLSQLIRTESGEDYYTHGMEVAQMLEELTDDPLLISVAILHDTLTHDQGLELLENSPLGPAERDLVFRMHSLRHLHVNVKTADLDRVIQAFTSDSRLLLLRMAHRLNDVRHFDRFKAKRRKQIAFETLHMYSVISGRLGFHRWRWQMEDACFAVLHPKTAQRMQELFDAHRDIDHACLAHTRLFIVQKLREKGIDASIDERIKGLYSTYRKMLLKKQNFEELSDRLALRVIVESNDDCYRALGVIHEAMHPIPGKLKDYIGMPKENGYRSLHTVVFPLPGVSHFPIEIQIRTPEMHRESEYGIASHSEYKTDMYQLTSSSARVNIFRHLEHLQSVAQSSRSFEDALKYSFNDNRLIIFDPKNGLYHLQRPATAMDAACQMYPSECAQIRGVRINGREQPLQTLLRDGDTVDVIMSAEPALLKEHLKAAKQKVTKKMLREAWQKQKEKVGV